MGARKSGETSASLPRRLRWGGILRQVSLELDCLVQGPALLAAGAIDIRVVGVDVGALGAAEDVIVAGARSEEATPVLGVSAIQD